MKNIIIILLCLVVSLCVAQPITLRQSENRIFPQATDGVNDYNLGTDGTNSFTISTFASITDVTINVLINFPSTVNSTTTGQRIFEIANTARTSLFGIDIGGFTTSVTDEYIGFFTNIAGTLRVAAVNTAAGSISAGWHMITITRNSNIYIDGVSQTTTFGTSTGPPAVFTNGYTINRLSIMASTSGSVPTAATWREFTILAGNLGSTNVADLYSYYTRQGNVTLANSKETLWKYYGASTGYNTTMLAQWQGKESGTDLLEQKNPTTKKLTKTNF